MREFIEAVEKMRNAQKAYFKFRNRSDLIEAKRLEAEVDQFLKNLHQLPPGLLLNKGRSCAQCNHDEWVHYAYWAHTVGADHEFIP